MPNNNKQTDKTKQAADAKKTGAVKPQSKAVPKANSKATPKAPVKTLAEPKRDFRDIVWKYLFPILAFLAVNAQNSVVVVVFAVIFIIFAIGKKPTSMLRRRTVPQTLYITLYVTLYLVAGLYSTLGAPAVRETVKIISAFVLFALVLMRTKDGEEKGILSVTAVVLAIVSFLCIDASTIKIFTKAYIALLKLFLCDRDIGTMGYETGVRITGIFGNANVSAGVLAFGVLISLYLVKTAATEKKRFAAFVILGVNALGFLLSFSMGAMVAFSLACVMFIIASGKGNRFETFLLMTETLFVTIIVSFFAIPFLGKSGPAGVVPLICSLLCGAAVWGLDRLVFKHISEFVAGKEKALGVVVGAIVAFAVVYVALAFNITGAMSLSSGDKLSRAEYLTAGSYKLTADASGKTEVLVYSQNEAQLMMHTDTPLYNGVPDGASFTVPEDTRVVWFVITADENARLNKIALSDGKALKLNYPLLPKIAANRLQGLFANQNLIQRTVFFKDGIKLFEKKPVFGSGLGSVEGWITSVQSFYYQTIYIHNHFIQVMDDMGLVGLASFVLMLLSVIFVLWKARKKTHEPFMFAAICACVVMMIAHSITEVVWSTGMYQSVVLLVFAVIIIAYGEPVEKFTGKLGGLIVAAVWAVVLVFSGLIGADLSASLQIQNFKAGDVQTGMATMRRLEKMDVYDDEYYKAVYVQNALSSGTQDEKRIAADYALQMRASNEYNSCFDLAAYYYLPQGQLDKMFEASRAAIAQKASNPDAWNAQLKFYRSAINSLTEDYMTGFVQGVRQTLDYMDEFNKGRMEQVQISDENKPFADAIKKLSSTNTGNSKIFEEMKQYAVK